MSELNLADPVNPTDDDYLPIREGGAPGLKRILLSALAGYIQTKLFGPLTGQALKIPRVKSDNSGFEFVSPGGGAGSWSLIETRVIAAPAAQFDFTGLGAYTDLLIIARDLVAAVSGARRLLVSTDGGATFYNTAGNYINIASDGVATNSAEGAITAGTSATTAKSILTEIKNSGGSAAPKIISNLASGVQRLFVADDANNIDAIRINNSGAGNIINTGTIYIFGRQ